MCGLRARTTLPAKESRRVVAASRRAFHHYRPESAAPAGILVDCGPYRGTFRPRSRRTSFVASYHTHSQETPPRHPTRSPCLEIGALGLPGARVDTPPGSWRSHSDFRVSAPNHGADGPFPETRPLLIAFPNFKQRRPRPASRTPFSRNMTPPSGRLPSPEHFQGSRPTGHRGGIFKEHDLSARTTSPSSALSRKSPHRAPRGHLPATSPPAPRIDAPKIAPASRRPWVARISTPVCTRRRGGHRGGIEGAFSRGLFHPVCAGGGWLTGLAWVFRCWSGGGDLRG